MKKVYEIHIGERAYFATRFAILNAKASVKISQHHGLPIRESTQAMANVDLYTAVPILVEDDALEPHPVAA
ncbi:MAG: hypothetical protein LBH13_07725 [Cellulomonadaceae bacterium]|nr:hypothetical protein [Cellulomonadaceae bacterium]